METVIFCALLLMFGMSWHFYRLGRSKGREQGERWSRQTLKEIRETRDLATKRLHEVQAENNELRRKWDVPTSRDALMECMTLPPVAPWDLHGLTKGDRAQVLERSIQKNSKQKRLGRHSPPPPPVRRVVVNPVGDMIHHDTSHVGPLDPCGIIGSTTLHNLIDDAVHHHTQDSYVAPVESPTTSYEAPTSSYEPPCSSGSSDYSSGSTDFGCSDTSSSSSSDW